jgi:NTP pyrophosphatase (non-canonical NTP hydrolase)
VDKAGEQSAARWIRTAEQRPEMDGVTYNVCRIDKRGLRYFDLATAQGQLMWYGFEKYGSGITHWKPLDALPPMEASTAEQSPEPRLGMNLVMLSEPAEKLTKLWAADDRLWTTQETVEFNLRTFARAILASESVSVGESPAPENDCKCEDCTGLQDLVTRNTPCTYDSERVAAPPEPAKVNLFELHERITGGLFPAYSNTDERFLALALAGETGELCNMVKKRWRDGADLTGEIRDEIADIRVYLELLAKCFGIEGEKLDQQVASKLQRVAEKFKDRLSGESRQ